MSFIQKLFRRQPAFKATCDISQEPMEQGYGYLLTTAQVVSSKKFWDNIMTEPDTMSYTISHFKNQDNTATQMRNMIFEKYSEIEKPWLISDSYIHLFDVDKNEARTHADEWWRLEGDYKIDNTGKAIEHLDADDFQSIRHYAIMEAGQQRIPA